MGKKYSFTGETKEYLGRTLHQIVAVRDFGAINEGDLGGWIEKEANLSHEGNVWVFEDAHVFGNAIVFGNAVVGGNAHVCGYAQVHGNARVSGDAWVYDDAHIYGNANVYGRARVYEQARVGDCAHIYGSAQLSGYSWTYGNAWVYGDAHVYSGANIDSNESIFWISNIVKQGSTETFYRTGDGSIGVACGVFFGTLDEFENEVEEYHSDDRYGNKCRLIIELAKEHIS